MAKRQNIYKRDTTEKRKHVIPEEFNDRIKKDKEMKFFHCFRFNEGEV